MRMTCLTLLLLAACSGGSGELPLTMRVDNLSSAVVAGEPITVRVVLLRGAQVASDYEGELRFAASVDATLPQPYTMTAADAGTHSFLGVIVFPETGPCTLTVSAEGVASDVSMALDVASKSTPPPSGSGGSGGIVPTPKVGALVRIEPALDGVDVIAAAIGDCNGDGKADIVVGTKAGEKNLVFLNRGDAQFDPPIEATDDALGSLIVADFNGDRVADLAYVDQGDQVLVRLNDGNGSFGKAKMLAFGAKTLKSGDIDGDGDLDLVAVGTHVMSCINDGSGNFSNGGQRWVNAWPIGAVALADFDADGDLDAATPGSVVLNDGNGRFDGTLLGFDCIGVSESVSGIDAADLDGDGDVDLAISVVPYPGDASMHVFLNDGHGVFTPNGQSLGTRVVSSVQLLDVDFDGDMDVLVGANDYGSLFWMNDGSGQFQRSFFADPPASARTIATGDLDGDGDRDVVIAEYLGRVYAYRHTYVVER